MAAFLFSQPRINNKEVVVKDKKQATSPAKKALNFIKRHKVLTIVALIIIFLIWLVAVPHGSENTSLNEKPDFPKVDVVGMTVKEACKKIKAAGWPKVTVSGTYGSWGVRDSNCDDKHTASYADYTNKDEKWGLDSSAEIVYDIGNYDDLTDSEKAKYKSLEENSSSNSEQSSDNDTTSDGNSSENWRKALKDYEAYVDKYVAFMKQYNANPDDPNLVKQYSEMLSKLNDYSDSIQKVKGDLSKDDLAEYNKTLARITQKLSSIQ